MVVRIVGGGRRRPCVARRLKWIWMHFPVRIDKAGLQDGASRRPLYRDRATSFLAHGFGPVGRRRFVEITGDEDWRLLIADCFNFRQHALHLFRPRLLRLCAPLHRCFQ